MTSAPDSTCCFTRPAGRRVDEPSATPAAAPAAGLHLENLKVLLVEDNLVNQLYAQAILHKHACETTIADNGIIAVECWRSARFDLILMDCHMPEMDGFESTRAIRAQEQSAGGSRTPIVGITASALPIDREACLAAGMDDVLVKPFSPQEFVDVIARWCKPVPSANLQPATRSTVCAPRKHDLLSVLLGFQQLSRRFVDAEMGTDDFLFEACRAVAQAMGCHDVVISTFCEVDDRLALRPLASYDMRCNALSEDLRPRFGRTADWRTLIEDGYRLPGEDLQTSRSLGEDESRGMLEVTYGMNAEPIGVLACGRHASGGAWTHEQVQLLRRIASRVGVALQRATGSVASSHEPGRERVLREQPVN